VELTAQQVAHTRLRDAEHLGDGGLRESPGRHRLLVSNPRPIPWFKRVRQKDVNLVCTTRGAFRTPTISVSLTPTAAYRSSLMHQADDQERLDRRAGRVVLKRPGLRLTVSGRPESQAERPAGRPRESGA
jgi:hypothetical protein